jgi:phosphotransferase system enzyme I (PtsI)
VIVSTELRVPPRAVPPEEVADEVRELERALGAAREDIRRLRDRVGGSDDPAHPILGAHLMILEDRDLIGELVAAISSERLDAAHVVQRTFQAKAQQLEALANEAFRARAADIRDVQGRVLGHLLGRGGASLAGVAPGSVVVASDLAPSEAANLDRERVAGLVLQHGTLTAHATIMARSRGVPAVVRVGDAVAVLRDGDELLVDGDRGRVVVAPDAADRAEHRRSLERERRARSALARERARPGETRDGRRVPVLANIDRPEDAPAALAAGAEGVGLYRTENLFLEAGGLPSEEAQAEAYRKVVDAFGDRPVTIRTLDLGGDKYTALMGVPREDNPFLGLRGIRYCLEHPEVFRTQLRAVLRSAGPTVRLLLPMVGGPEQVHAAREHLAEAARELRAAGRPAPDAARLGVMIEVPSAVLTADRLARTVDYFSIGSNDLVQYCLAVDRGNERIARLYDALDPAVLRAIDLTVRHAHEAGIRVGSCGEMSGELPGALLLIGLGVDELSVTPYRVAQVRALLARVEAESLGRLARRCLEGDGPQEVRRILREHLQRDPQFRLEDQNGGWICHWDPAGEAPPRGGGDPGSDD